MSNGPGGNAGVCLIRTPSSPSRAAGSVLWGPKQGDLTESDSRWKAVVIPLVNGCINSGANHFTYLASGSQAVLWKPNVA